MDGQYAAVVLEDQDLPLKLAYIYNNTVYTSQQGIFFGNAAQTADAVTGNLVFAGTPISEPIKHESKNLTDTLANAPNYVNSPSFVLGVMNFYPLPGKVEGPPWTSLHSPRTSTITWISTEFRKTSSLERSCSAATMPVRGRTRAGNFRRALNLSEDRQHARVGVVLKGLLPIG